VEAIQHWVLEFAESLPRQRINPVTVANYANLPVNQVVHEFLLGSALSALPCHYRRLSTFIQSI